MSNPHKNKKWYIGEGAGKRPIVGCLWLLTNGYWDNTGCWDNTGIWISR